MTALGKTATLFGVEVDVVGPHLEGAGVAVGGEVGREVEIHPNFVVLHSYERQVQPRIRVEEEHEREENSGTVGGSG